MKVPSGRAKSGRGLAMKIIKPNGVSAESANQIVASIRLA